MAGNTHTQAIDHAFGLIPQAFSPARAEGKSFNFFFEIEGHPGKSLVLQGGALTVHDGKTGAPTCIIKTDADTVVGMFTGTVRPEAAFMEGKLNPSDPMELMALPEVIDLKKLSALAAATPAPTPSAAPLAGAPSAIDRAFALLPQAFSPARAEGKAFNFFFEIEGHPGKSLVLQGGALTVHDGKTGAPTCIIKTDADTVVGMFTGTVRPEAAFMAGKLNPSDPMALMTLPEVIDLKKLSALAAAPAPAAKAAPSAQAAPAPQAALDNPTLRDCFEALPLGFKADRVGNWEKRIYFDVAGAEGYTLTVADGQALVTPGAKGDAEITLSLDSAETAIGLLTGKLDPQKAFMDGKFKASNLGAMMKFTQLFTFQPPPAPVAEAQADAAPAGPDRLALIGKRFPGWLAMTTADEMVAYARAVGEDNPAYLDTEAGIVAHPIFPVFYTLKGMKQAWDDDALQLDTLRLVHGEQDMRLHAPIRPGDLLNWRSVLTNVEEKAKGTLVELSIYAWSDGVKVVETTTSLFIRSRGMNPLAPKATLEKKSPRPAEAPRGKIVVSHSVSVDEDQPRRYAEASGDHNPIHLDDAVAAKAGLPGVILHGLCTMALATKGFVDQAAGGDPTRLKRFSVRFSKPVLPGSTLTTEGWILEELGDRTVYGFEVKNEDDVAVIVNGRAEVAKG